MNGDELAYPLHRESLEGYTETHFGLSKREAFAMAAMQGFLANKAHGTHFDPRDDAAYCISVADAVLAALEAK